MKKLRFLFAAILTAFAVIFLVVTIVTPPGTSPTAELGKVVFLPAIHAGKMAVAAIPFWIKVVVGYIVNSVLLLWWMFATTKSAEELGIPSDLL